MSHIAPISPRYTPFGAAACAGGGAGSTVPSLSLIERVKKAVQAIFTSIVYWLTLPFQKQMKSGEFLDTLKAIQEMSQENVDQTVVIQSGAFEDTSDVEAAFKTFWQNPEKTLFLCPIIVKGTFSGNHIVAIAYSKETLIDEVAGTQKDPFMLFFDSKGRSIRDRRNKVAKNILDGFLEITRSGCYTNTRAFQGFFDGHSCGPHVLRVFELLMKGKTPDEIYTTLSSENIEETRERYQELRAPVRRRLERQAPRYAKEDDILRDKDPHPRLRTMTTLSSLTHTKLELEPTTDFRLHQDRMPPRREPPSHLHV